MMAKKIRHRPSEIFSMLQKASDMELAGQSQHEICKSLGISVMTLHRWRKAPIRKGSPAPEIESHGSPDRSPSRLGQSENAPQDIDGLRLENWRLRKLVTDLLLEKLALEEAIGVKGKKSPLE